MAVQRKSLQFGMLHLFENPVHKAEHQIVKEQPDLMQAAEEFALFDLMIDGCLDCGVGRGYQPKEEKFCVSSVAAESSR